MTLQTLELEAQVSDFLQRLDQAYLPDHQITSWRRTAAHNREVGGHPDSQHLLGLAVDIVGPRLPEIADLATVAGLVPVMEPTHLHVQRWPAGALRGDLDTGFLRDLDVDLNELLGGQPGQTLSARIGERIASGRATLGEKALCDLLDVFDADHCQRAYESYRGHAETRDLAREQGYVPRKRYRAVGHLHVCEECDTDPCCCEKGDEPWWLKPDPHDLDDDDA